MVEAVEAACAEAREATGVRPTDAPLLPLPLLLPRALGAGAVTETSSSPACNATKC